MIVAYDNDMMLEFFRNHKKTFNKKKSW